jgi:hypothetical protein
MKTRLLTAIAASFLFAAALHGQVKYGGYLSFEYDKGQDESLDPRGSIQNIKAGFLAAGVIQSKFHFALEARYWGNGSVSQTGDAPFQLEQAWVGFSSSKAFSIKAGLYLVPFGRYNTASRAHETLLVGTPLNIVYLYPPSWRDLGVLTEGQFSVVSYAFYFGNGLKEADTLAGGQQFGDNNKDKGKGGRFGLKLSEGFQTGISYYTGKIDDLDQRNLRLEGIDLAWVTEQWEIWGEATRGKLANPEPYADGLCEGFSIWTVMKSGRIQPVGSYQQVKYTDPFHGDGGVAIDQSRWTAGLRLVLAETLFIKVEYEWNNESPAELKNNLFRIQAALGF